MKNFTLYMHTFPNGKVYIGITCQEPTQRWVNGYGYRNQQLIWRAIEKYGWDNIHHIVVKDNLTQEEAEKLEIEMISLYDSTNTEKGYNVSRGGLANSAGFKHTEEAKRKMSEHKKGKKMSDETRKRMSIARRGEGNPFYGKKFGKEHRKALSESHLGIIPSNAKAIICVETGKRYVSIAEAQRTEHINNIWVSLDKPNRSAGGFHWTTEN